MHPQQEKRQGKQHPAVLAHRNIENNHRDRDPPPSQAPRYEEPDGEKRAGDFLMRLPLVAVHRPAQVKRETGERGDQRALAVKVPKKIEYQNHQRGINDALHQTVIAHAVDRREVAYRVRQIVDRRKVNVEIGHVSGESGCQPQGPATAPNNGLENSRVVERATKAIGVVTVLTFVARTKPKSPAAATKSATDHLYGVSSIAGAASITDSPWRSRRFPR
jgi:hypothetical protein